jgi:hypothetical protein
VGESLDSGRTGSKRVGELAAAAAVADVLDRLVEAMAGYIRAARADNTWRAYEADLKHFASWCALEGLSPLPAAPTPAPR